MDRRRFIKITGGFAASATLINSCGPLTQSELGLVEPIGPGLESFKVTLCGGCSGGCSVIVRLIDDRAVGIRGNPLSPLNRGHLCPRGSANLQNLYNPDRIRTPLSRIGHRGDGEWEEISWDDALRKLAGKLSRKRSEGKAHRVAMLAGDTGRLDLDLAERFFKAYGSPNFITHSPTGLYTQSLRNLYGAEQSIGYDLENCNYLLCFGDPLGTGSAPVWMQGIFGYLRQGRTGARTKIVHVGSRMNLTAANADQHISVRPGSEGALALGIAYILIQKDLYDHDFIDNYTHGFNVWRKDKREYSGFKENVLSNYSPRRVSEITGVPIHVISRLADEFVRNRPALALSWYAMPETTNSVYNLMAIESLNALAGSIDRSGGVILQRGAPLKPWSEVDLDKTAIASGSRPRLDERDGLLKSTGNGDHQAAIETMASRKPYPVDVLITLGSNPIYNEWGGSGYNRNYEQVDFIVSMSSFMNETSQYADLVLPINVDFESIGYGDTVPGTNIPAQLSLRQPVVNTVHDTMQAGDIFIRLAGMMGGSVATSMSWKDSGQALDSLLDGIVDSNEGMITAGSYEKDWLRSLAALGWKSAGFRGRDDFRKQLASNGGWWNPLYAFGRWKRNFSTPSGKFEFASLTLLGLFKENYKNDSDPLSTARRELHLDASEDELIQPHYEPPEFDGDAAAYPLILLPYLTVGLGEGSGANLPMMQEFIDPLYSTTWENVVELHPDVARSLGVVDQDEVVVESPSGRLHCRVKVNKSNRPDVACIALGQGHSEYGRYATGNGANPKAILSKKFDRLGGGVALATTRVRVRRV